MNNKILSIYTVLFLMLGSISVNAAVTQFGTYINKNYNYEIIVPASWQKEESGVSENHLMYAKLNSSTGIKVRALKSSTEDIEKIIHSETWDLKKVDPRLNKILETEKIQIQKNISGKLLLFDYRARNNNMLQRTLIAINGGIIYIIECKSPINTFYKYEDIFTTALASFKYIDNKAVFKASAPKEEIKKDQPIQKSKPEEQQKEETLEEDEQL